MTTGAADRASHVLVLGATARKAGDLWYEATPSCRELPFRIGLAGTNRKEGRAAARYYTGQYMWAQTSPRALASDSGTVTNSPYLPDRRASGGLIADAEHRSGAPTHGVRNYCADVKGSARF